jgi:hypothetical protein
MLAATEDIGRKTRRGTPSDGVHHDCDDQRRFEHLAKHQQCNAQVSARLLRNQHAVADGLMGIIEEGVALLAQRTDETAVVVSGDTTCSRLKSLLSNSDRAVSLLRTSNLNFVLLGISAWRVGKSYDATRWPDVRTGNANM